MSRLFVPDRLLFVVAVLYFVLPCAAQTDLNTSAIDQAVMAEMKRQDLVGVAIGVLRGGKVVYVKGYGFADRETQTPVPGEIGHLATARPRPGRQAHCMELCTRARF